MSVWQFAHCAESGNWCASLAETFSFRPRTSATWIAIAAPRITASGRCRTFQRCRIRWYRSCLGSRPRYRSRRSARRCSSSHVACSSSESVAAWRSRSASLALPADRRWSASARSSSEAPGQRLLDLDLDLLQTRTRVLDREVPHRAGDTSGDGLIDDAPRDPGQHEHDQDRERDLAGRDARGDRVEPRVHQDRDERRQPDPDVALQPDHHRAGQVLLEAAAPLAGRVEADQEHQHDRDHADDGDREERVVRVAAGVVRALQQRRPEREHRAHDQAGDHDPRPRTLEQLLRPDGLGSGGGAGTLRLGVAHALAFFISNPISRSVRPKTSTGSTRIAAPTGQAWTQA